MSKINILYQSSIPHIKMGGQKSLLALIDNLDFNKYEPQVIVPELGNLSEELAKRGIKYHIARIPAFKPIKIFKVLKSYFEVSKLINENGFSIVHSDHDKFMIFVSYMSKKFKTVYHARVVHSHKYDKHLQSRMNSIIGISDGVLQRFDKSINTDNLHKIYNGVDCDLFIPLEDRIGQKRFLGLDTMKFTVLFVGQMKEGKGIFDLIKAANKLKGNPISFIFVGDFLDESIKESWFEYKDNNALDNVKWLGQKNKIQEWMQASDLLVLPSHEGIEGMGRVIFESMACGTPAIASDTSGVREAITPETGILFKEKSVEGISDAILELMNNNEKWNQFSIAGRKRALEVFDIKKHAENVMKLYQRLLNEKG
ncbi:MAG: glycosyltransferase family 4 protein [Candidatus Kapaibacterium sp.]